MSKSLEWCASKLINCLIIAGGNFFFPWQLHIANQLRQTHDSLSLSHMHTFFLLFLHRVQTQNRENWKPFVETRRMGPISRKRWFESSLINFQPLLTFLWDICPLCQSTYYGPKKKVWERAPSHGQQPSLPAPCVSFPLVHPAHSRVWLSYHPAL